MKSFANLSILKDKKKPEYMTIGKEAREQDHGRVVNLPAFGSKGPRFDPWRQPFVHLS